MQMTRGHRFQTEEQRCEDDGIYIYIYSAWFVRIDGLGLGRQDGGHAPDDETHGYGHFGH